MNFGRQLMLDCDSVCEVIENLIDHNCCLDIIGIERMNAFQVIFDLRKCLPLHTAKQCVYIVI